MARAWPLPFVAVFAFLIGTVGSGARSLPGAAQGATPTTGTPRPSIDRPLDLAWAASGPADLDAAGYGALRSGYQPLSAYFPRLGPPAGDPAAVSRAAAGWSQTYEGWMALPNADDPDHYDRSIRTTLTHYRAKDAAHAGYAAATAGYTASGYEAGTTAPAVGAEATALRAVKTESGTNRVFKALLLVWRTDTVVVELQVRDYADDAPALSATLPLATTVAQRVAAALAGKAPNLSLAVVRPSDGAVTPDADRYVWRAGTAIGAVNQSSAMLGAASSFDRDHAIVDRYWYHVAWARSADPNATHVAYSVAAFRFEDVVAARRFLADYPRQWSANPGPGYSDLDPEPAPVAAGDAAVMIGFTQQQAGDVVAAGFQGWV